MESPVPSQQVGVQSNTVYKITANTETEAEKTYKRAKEKLLMVNHWHDICGPHSANFQLTDNHGRPLEEPARPGDYIRIGLPTPDNQYDWVRIESIDDKSTPSGVCSYLVMRVRPAENPASNDTSTAHFYESTATSSFIVERAGHSIRAGVYGRNEKINDSRDKIRNMIISLAAMLGLHKPQWKSLVKGLLRA